jgi:cyanophycinase-like exopeptidase
MRERSDAVLLGIDERTAAVWHDGAWRVMGPGTVTVIRSGTNTTFGSGQAIEGVPDPG